MTPARPNTDRDSAIPSRSPERLRYAIRTISKSRDKIILPKIDRLSKLSLTLIPNHCNQHPQNDPHYPLILGCLTPDRVRVLALGGPYEQSISYRRELGGNLHSRHRCYLCFEGFTTNTDKSPGGFRKEVVAWGMRWCEGCLQQWTISTQEISNFDELHTVLSKYEENAEIKSVWSSRFRGPFNSSWKPFVDAVLRKHIHMDFDTAVAKNNYTQQVNSSLTAVKQPITTLRRALRQDLVKVAQELSITARYSGVAATLAKSTFVTPTDLPKYLFPAHKLSEEKMFEPYDPDEQWIFDPTMALKSVRDVRRKLGDAMWKSEQARAMLDRLFNPRDFGGRVTTFLQAADSWHVRRISKNISADATIIAFNEKYPSPVSPFITTPSSITIEGDEIDCHLDVLLSKLFIYRNHHACLPQLSPHGLKLAKEYFKKLALETCAVCPHTGLLSLPRGVEGVVRHYRECHASRYWYGHKWSIIG